MYGIQVNGRVLRERFASWEEAVEAAQERYALPADGDWTVVRFDKQGNAN